MGKKMGVNEKVAAARARKEEAKQTAKAQAAKASEDAAWAKYENPKGKKDVKKEEEERKRQEAAAKKAELKKLAAEEEAAMANLGKPKSGPKPGKVTAHQLYLQKEAEKRRQAQQAAAGLDENKRTVTEEDYAAQVDVEIDNRAAVAVDARSVDAALSQLSIGGDSTSDRHPEKRAKAAWKEYYERELIRMKEEKPGLKLMQYKSRIFENWQRSPENPRNQVAK